MSEKPVVKPGPFYRWVESSGLVLWLTIVSAILGVIWVVAKWILGSPW